MKIQVETVRGVPVAVVEAVQISGVQSALELLMSVRYETGCDRVALPKQALPPEFFQLRTGLAGEILQKFVNYQMKLAIWGMDSSCASAPLRDFIRESNRGRHVFFVTTRAEALERLGK